MRVAIVETRLKGHWPSVNALMKIFASDKGNEVLVFVTPAVAEVISPLNSMPNIRIIEKKDEIDLSRFLESVRDHKPDMIFLNTFEYDPWSQYPLIGKNTFLTIHNLDECFHELYGSELFFYLNNIFRIVKHHPAAEFVKRPQLYVGDAYRLVKWRKACVERLVSEGGTVVVLSRNVKETLLRKKPGSRAVAIPFSVYEGSTRPAAGNGKLHVCIPGSVSVHRRDYWGLLSALETEEGMKLRDRIRFDMLGIIDIHSGGLRILEKVKELIRKGWEIRYFMDFVDAVTGDAEMGKADVLLGNLRMGERYFRYSVTKESGIPFNMIRAARPGIMPSGCRTVEGLESSTLYYRDNTGLLKVLEKLAEDKTLMAALAGKALENALKFTPEKIYLRLKEEINFTVS